MTTWTQDYPALPGSADAAGHLAHTVVAAHLPGRLLDAHPLVEQLVTVALAKSSPNGNLNLITVAAPQRIRFELHYPADLDGAPDPPGAHRAVSSLADAYGERRTRTGRMIYAELWDRP